MEFLTSSVLTSSVAIEHFVFVCNVAIWGLSFIKNHHQAYLISNKGREREQSAGIIEGVLV